MKAILSTIACILLISACSSKPAKTAEVNEQDENQVIYNTEEPTSYAEYREWRKQNHPASEAYADYKEWQINYRKWQLEQEQQ